MIITKQELQIFSRQLILREFTEKKFKFIQKQHVAIIGIGGIGCPVALYLIATGIKRLTLIDNDIIQLNFFSAIAFFSGFAADKYIDNHKIFGTDLNAYYKEVGAGLWGGLALVFAVVISYMKQKLLVKYVIWVIAR